MKSFSVKNVLLLSFCPFCYILILRFWDYFSLTPNQLNYSLNICHRSVAFVFIDIHLAPILSWPCRFHFAPLLNTPGQLCSIFFMIYKTLMSIWRRREKQPFYTAFFTSLNGWMDKTNKQDISTYIAYLNVSPSIFPFLINPLPKYRNTSTSATKHIYLDELMDACYLHSLTRFSQSNTTNYLGLRCINFQICFPCDIIQSI